MLWDMACCMWVYNKKQLHSCFHLTRCLTSKELVPALNHSITYTNQTVVNCFNGLLCTEKRVEGRGEETDRGRRRRKKKGEDDRGEEKGEVSPDVLEEATSSSWAQQALEQSRRESTKCMNWRESNGDHCKEVEMLRSVQWTKMVKWLQTIASSKDVFPAILSG